ncbi:hypothetical protein MKX03_029629 [Papaver bracteatum]|nr:hypothetical protein MKX03_029629 [Papaver bracteatum]
MAWACKNDSKNTGETINLILLTGDGVKHLYKEKKAEDLMKFYEEWIREHKVKERETRLGRSRSKKEQMKSDGEGQMKRDGEGQM